MAKTLLPGLAISVLSLVCLVLIMRYLRVALFKTGWQQKRQQSVFILVLLVAAGWVIILGILAGEGFFSNFSALPPRPVFALVPPLAVIVIISFTSAGKELLAVIPPQWLVYMQSFRIVVEMILWIAFSEGLLPKQMTFEGRNFDILSGILALIAGWMIQQQKKGWRTIAVGYNIIGLLLLLNIVSIAVLSMPTPFRYFMNEPASTVITDFPFIYLPGILVVIAATLHIFSLRQLVVIRGRKPGGPKLIPG